MYGHRSAPVKGDLREARASAPAEAMAARGASVGGPNGGPGSQNGVSEAADLPPLLLLPALPRPRPHAPVHGPGRRRSVQAVVGCGGGGGGDVGRDGGAGAGAGVGVLEGGGAAAEGQRLQQGSPQMRAGAEDERRLLQFEQTAHRREEDEELQRGD